MNTRALQANLTEALNDEYQARALYRKVIQAFGPVRPFVNIIEAEQRHIEALLPLFESYGFPVPQDDWDERIKSPASLLEACRLGVEAEIANAAMYDRLLASTQAPDARTVFRHLQAASRERHLPAFQRCVARGARSAPDLYGGRRCGRGKGRRHGARAFRVIAREPGGACIGKEAAPGSSGEDLRMILWDSAASEPAHHA